MAIEKTATAEWRGGLKDGTGKISTQSGVLSSQPYGFNTRFEGQPGTNPEELIGAAHAGCFSMALSLILGNEGMTADKIETTATVTLEQQNGGFAITKCHLDTEITVNGGNKEKVLECANTAKENCPVSKVLSCDITMDARAVV